MNVSGLNPNKFIDSWIGKRLQQLRCERGYPVSYIASIVGVSDDVYEQIECGETCIPMRKLNRLSTLFDVKITDFFDDAKAFLLDLERKRRTPARENRSIFLGKLGGQGGTMQKVVFEGTEVFLSKRKPEG